MKGRSVGLLLGAGGVLLTLAVAAGCWVSPRGRVYGPAPAVTVAPAPVHTTPVVQVAPPVRPVVVARSCPVGWYWSRGRYRWFAGRYLWVAGRCRPIPYQYRARRCRYYPGRWVRVYGGWRRTRGAWRCY